jgi:hypothetical protein
VVDKQAVPAELMVSDRRFWSTAQLRDRPIGWSRALEGLLFRRYGGIEVIEVWRFRLDRLRNEHCYQLLQYKYGYIVIMCDNLDVEGKRGVPWSGQSLNTVVGSCEPARDS